MLQIYARQTLFSNPNPLKQVRQTLLEEQFLQLAILHGMQVPFSASNPGLQSPQKLSPQHVIQLSTLHPCAMQLPVFCYL